MDVARLSPAMSSSSSPPKSPAVTAAVAAASPQPPALPAAAAAAAAASAVWVVEIAPDPSLLGLHAALLSVAAVEARSCPQSVVFALVCAMDRVEAEGGESISLLDADERIAEQFEQKVANSLLTPLADVCFKNKMPVQSLLQRCTSREQGLSDAVMLMSASRLYIARPRDSSRSSSSSYRGLVSRLPPGLCLVLMEQDSRRVRHAIIPSEGGPIKSKATSVHVSPQLRAFISPPLSPTPGGGAGSSGRNGSSGANLPSSGQRRQQRRNGTKNRPKTSSGGRQRLAGGEGSSPLRGSSGQRRGVMGEEGGGEEEDEDEEECATGVDEEGRRMRRSKSQSPLSRSKSARERPGRSFLEEEEDEWWLEQDKRIQELKAWRMLSGADKDKLWDRKITPGTRRYSARNFPMARRSKLDPEAPAGRGAEDTGEKPPAIATGKGYSSTSESKGAEMVRPLRSPSASPPEANAAAVSLPPSQRSTPQLSIHIPSTPQNGREISGARSVQLESASTNETSPPRGMTSASPPLPPPYRSPRPPSDASPLPLPVASLLSSSSPSTFPDGESPEVEHVPTSASSNLRAGDPTSLELERIQQQLLQMQQMQQYFIGLQQMSLLQYQSANGGGASPQAMPPLPPQLPPGVMSQLPVSPRHFSQMPSMLQITAQLQQQLAQLALAAPPGQEPAATSAAATGTAPSAPSAAAAVPAGAGQRKGAGKRGQKFEMPIGVILQKGPAMGAAEKDEPSGEARPLVVELDNDMSLAAWVEGTGGGQPLSFKTKIMAVDEMNGTTRGSKGTGVDAFRAAFHGRQNGQGAGKDGQNEREVLAAVDSAANQGTSPRIEKEKQASSPPAATVAATAGAAAVEAAPPPAAAAAGASPPSASPPKETKPALRDTAECRRFTADQIISATDGFSPANLIGRGGFGPVYRGELYGCQVAMKKLDVSGKQGYAEFQTEIDVLSRLRHPHIVLLMGHCPEEQCLVYEFMSGGSLRERLIRSGAVGHAPLAWFDRLRIASELAGALLYMHQHEPPILHRDLKPSNILLDANLTAKISDVGLARALPSDSRAANTGVRGTIGYIDPDHVSSGRTTEKSDLYALGVTLLQLLTGIVNARELHDLLDACMAGGSPGAPLTRCLPVFMNQLDQSAGMWDGELTEQVLFLALQCVEGSRARRPDLGKVVQPRLAEVAREMRAKYSQQAVKSMFGGATSMKMGTKTSSKTPPLFSTVVLGRNDRNKQASMPVGQPQDARSEVLRESKTQRWWKTRSTGGVPRTVSRDSSEDSMPDKNPNPMFGKWKSLSLSFKRAPNLSNKQ